MVVRLSNEDPTRLARIHNEKWLRMGLDKESLEAQISSKLKAHDVECQDARRQGALRDAQAQAAELAHQLQEAAYKHAAKQLLKERQEKQGLPQARDWDLSRPDQLRIDCPARIGDDDPRCGPASLQKFAGEDLSANETRRQHHHENAVNWGTQMGYLKQAKETANLCDQAHQAKVRELDALQQAAMQEERLSQRRAAILAQNANKALHAHQLKEVANEIAAEKQADISELHAALTSPFLNEIPAHPKLCNSGRVQIADFKGMNKDQIQDIHADLRKQLEGREVAAHEARAKAAKDSQDLADLHLQLRQQLLKAEMTKLRHQREYKQFLELQVEQQKDQNAKTKSAFANQVSDAYFDQFERSHR